MKKTIKPLCIATAIFVLGLLTTSFGATAQTTDTNAVKPIMDSVKKAQAAKADVYVMEKQRVQVTDIRETDASARADVHVMEKQRTDIGASNVPAKKAAAKKPVKTKKKKKKCTCHKTGSTK